MKVLHWGRVMTRAGCPSVVRDGHVTLYLVSDGWGNHIRETKRILIQEATLGYWLPSDHPGSF